ncbi:MAG: hypothetical protein KDD61_05965 [Bdellovibrionales bacterium]|nr:hypothetical protein [Bdellovibrionales bacterium]
MHEIEVLDFVYKQTLDDSFFSAPKPYHDLSTEKVLAMEYCEGVTLNQWIQTNPGVGSRRIVGVKLLDHFVREFLEWNVVQTDPNFGNFLVQEDPLKVILLDFGSTLRYSKEFIDEYKKTILVAQSGDVDKTFEQAVAFGLLDAREGQDVRQHFLLMMQLSIEPFVSMDQPFDFSSLDYERRSRAAVLNFTKSLKFSPPPRKIIFLHRKLGGLFNLMKRLDVQIDLRPYWQQIFSPDQKT